MIDKQAVLERINYKSFYQSHIPSLKVNGKVEIVAHCVFHDDQHPSLSINLDSGLYNCFACGAKGDVFGFYQQLKGTDFPTALKEIAEMQGIAETPKEIAIFEYRDIEGKILYTKTRVQPGRNGKSKEFLFKHLDENNKWQMGRGGDSVPYNLPLVIQSRYICITEGEAKADFLVKQFGLVATCFDSGSQSPFKDDYFKYFEGKEKIIILPDNDKPGEQYTNKIASALYGKVEKIKVVKLPGLREAEDILDWVKIEGNDKDKLLSLVKEANEWTPKKGEITETGIVHLDTVIAEKVDWLWSGYIPLGKLTLIDGDPGLGKSLLSVDLASRLTTGQPMPDGTPSIQGGVVLMSLEDGLGDTIVPRLNVVGADKTKIVALQGIPDANGKLRFPTVADTEAIKKACESVDAKLVVIDPLMGYLSAKVNSWVDKDVRRDLSPLAKMAEDIGVSVIIVRHLNKASSSNSVYRGGGSIGIIGAARSALLIAKNPENENQRILAGIKSNLAPLPPSLSYTIENVDGVPKIVWGGVTSHTADSLLAIPSSPEERSATEDAADFLKDALSGGAVDSKEMMRQARQAGIAERTLHRAKKVLGVTSKRDAFGRAGKWLWCLDCQDMPKVANINSGNLKGSLATLGDSMPPEDGEIDLTKYGHPINQLDGKASGSCKNALGIYCSDCPKNEGCLLTDIQAALCEVAE
jgi:putative DNA primase/helicase